MLRQEGSLRSWSNGNLHAMLEPTSRGHRLRLQTLKGDARMLLGFGAGMLLAAGVVAIPLALSSHVTAPGTWLGPGFMALIGAASLARAAVTLPSWARTRSTQMERFAQAAARILEEVNPPALPRPAQ